jgi:hypothetical protein
MIYAVFMLCTVIGNHCDTPISTLSAGKNQAECDQINNQINSSPNGMDKNGNVIHAVSLFCVEGSQPPRETIFIHGNPELKRATAQGIGGHVSAATVSKIESRFTYVFIKGGMNAVVADITACYASTNDQKTSMNKMAVTACLLYDYSAALMDKNWRQAFVANAEPDPGATPYLAERAWTARREIYASIPFLNTREFDQYFGDAPDKIGVKVMNAAGADQKAKHR